MDTHGIGYDGPQKTGIEEPTPDADITLKYTTYGIDPTVCVYLYLLLGIFVLMVILIICTRCMTNEHPTL